MRRSRLNDQPFPESALLVENFDQQPVQEHDFDSSNPYAVSNAIHDETDRAMDYDEHAEAMLERAMENSPLRSCVRQNVDAVRRLDYTVWRRQLRGKSSTAACLIGLR